MKTPKRLKRYIKKGSVPTIFVKAELEGEGFQTPREKRKVSP